jgi:hypothetical protein
LKESHIWGRLILHFSRFYFFPGGLNTQFSVCNAKLFLTGFVLLLAWFFPKAKDPRPTNLPDHTPRVSDDKKNKQSNHAHNYSSENKLKALIFGVMLKHM